jgi:Flp pilus assembly protein TadG
VEFALVLPILLLVVLGIVDLGRAVNYWNGETSLANDAARIVSVGTLPSSGPCGTNNTSVTSIQTYMSCALQNQYGITPVASGNGLQSSGLSYCVSVPSNSPGQPVTVKISGNYSWLPFLKFGGSTATSTISGSATMPLVNTVGSSMYTTTSSC